MAGEIQVTLSDIKIELADAVIEAAYWKREFANAQRVIEQLQKDNTAHKRTIEQLSTVPAGGSEQP